MPDLDKVYDLISKVALREELELRSVSSGIFSIQELAFVYIVGKEIALKAIDIFGTKDICWYTEKQIEKTPKTTRTDLVFEDNEGSPVLAIEFKTRKEEGVCLNDIKKLKEIKSECIKVFCALVEKDKEPKEPNVWFGDGVKPLYNHNKGNFEKFPTIDYHTDSSRPSGKTCCIVAAWEVVSEIS
jgi:hypothetical protein